MYNHYICSNNIVYCVDIRSLKSSKFVRMKASVCYLGVLLKGKHIGSICCLLFYTRSRLFRPRIHCRWRLQSLSLSSKPMAFEQSGKTFYRATLAVTRGLVFFLVSSEDSLQCSFFFRRARDMEVLFLPEFTWDICNCAHVYRIKFFQCNI